VPIFLLKKIGPTTADRCGLNNSPGLLGTLLEQFWRMWAASEPARELMDDVTAVICRGRGSPTPYAV
jgi:hypothetical protein